MLFQTAALPQRDRRPSLSEMPLQGQQTEAEHDYDQPDQA